MRLLQTADCKEPPSGIRRGSRVKLIPAPQFRDIEPLEEKHDKLRAARQDAKKRAAVPYVLVSADDRIAGYYTLSSDNIRIDDLSPDLVKQLKLPRYRAIGATLIGRLARDLSFRGQGIGGVLLAGALKVALASSPIKASAAVLVEVKNDNGRRFYAGFGFLAFPDTLNRLFLPMQTIEKLLPEIGSAR